MMDDSALLKNVVSACRQQHGSHNDHANKCIIKAVEELHNTLSSTPGKVSELFAMHNRLAVECVTQLLSLCSESKHEAAALPPVLPLLSIMMQDCSVLESVQVVHDAVRILAGMLTEGTHHSDHVTYEVLELLRTLTYSRKVDREPYMQDLVLFLLKSIDAKKSPEVLRSSMGVLAHLCRHDGLGVQMQLRATSSGKTIGKLLIPNLSHKDQTIVISTLAVITNLCMDDDLGKMLFNAKNLSQTMQLIFNVIIKASSQLSLVSAVDLLCDLLKTERIQKFLMSYENLHPFLREVLKQLPVCERWVSVKLMQLLQALSSRPTLRQVIGCLIDRHETQMSFLFTLLQLASQKSVTNDCCEVSALALHLLRNFLEYFISGGDNSGLSPSLEPEMEAILQCAISNIGQLDSTLLPATGKNLCAVRSKVTEALLLLHSLCLHPHIQQSSINKSATQSVALLLEQWLKAGPPPVCTRAVLSCSDTVGLEAQEYSEMSVNVVLHILKLLFSLRENSEMAKKLVAQILEDAQIAPYIAHGLGSAMQERVQLAIEVLSGSGWGNVPISRLSDLMTARNSQKLLVPAHNDCNPCLNGSKDCGSHAVASNGVGDTKELLLVDKKCYAMGFDQDPSIRSLISKVESGLEIKDLRTSEIISVYEHKLRAAETKGEHLQDLFDAKALALTQADRLIQQYRTRMTHSDVEAQKLRGFLREAEKRCEDGREQLNEMVLDHEQLQVELERLHAEGGRLEAHCAELARKLDTAQRAASAQRQEYDTIKEMHEALAKYNENLKEQHRGLEKGYEALEETNAKVNQQLKDREAKIAEATKLKQKQEETLAQLGKEKAELDQAVDTLQEKERKLNKKITSLGETCKANEAVIREKDEIIKEQRGQLDKTVQMMSLINQITSSGRLPEQQQSYGKQ